MESVAITFPGQGSQQPGAGTAWRGTPGWALVEAGSDALGRDLGTLLCDTAAEELKRPWEAQVSTYLVSMLAWQAWRERRPDDVPTAFAGHSLGEWTALAAAGAVDPLAGLRLVSARGTAMAAAAAARPGGMAAVLGAEDDAVEAACAAGPAEVWPANYNAAGQLVISGDPAAFAAVGEAAGARRTIPLPVGGAYHTPWMAPAAADLARALTVDPPGTASAPVWSNVDATPRTDGFAPVLAAQLTSPVRWRQTVEGLLAAGVDSFVELGPGTVLTTLVKRIAPDAARRSVATPEELT